MATAINVRVGFICQIESISTDLESDFFRVADLLAACRCADGKGDIIKLVGFGSFELRNGAARIVGRPTGITRAVTAGGNIGALLRGVGSDGVE